MDEITSLTWELDSTVKTLPKLLKHFKKLPIKKIKGIIIESDDYYALVYGLVGFRYHYKIGDTIVYNNGDVEEVKKL